MKQKLGINKKYALFISTLGFIILAIVLVSMGVIIQSESATLKEKLRQILRVSYSQSEEAMLIGHARYFSYNIFNSLYHLDIKRINFLIDKLKAEMPIDSVWIADDSGKVLTDGTDENPSFGKKLTTDISLLKSKRLLVTDRMDGHIVAFTIGMNDHIEGYGEILFSDKLLKSTIQQQDEMVFSMLKEIKRQFLGIALTGILFIVFFTIFLGFVYSRTLTSPLLKLRDAIKKVAKGDLHYRLEVQSRDELGDLADSFNRMAEELLKTTVSKVYVDNIIKNMNDILIVVSMDGKIKTMNQAALALLGYTQDELLNQPFEIILKEEKTASEGTRLNDLLNEGSPVVHNIEKIFFSKDGRRIPVLLSGSVMRNGDGKGKIQELLYVALDITEHKAAEEELAKYREHLEELVKDRTRELMGANKQLREEINERKQIEESLIKSEEETRSLAQENATVAEIGRIISSTLDIQKVYERFAEEVHKLIPSERIAINLINLDKYTTTIAYTAGVEVPERSHGDTIPLTGTFTEEVVRTRESHIIQDEEGEIASRFPGLIFSLKRGLRSMMSVPLISKDQVIGILHVRSTKPNAYTEKDLSLAERVANQIAGVIDNAQLFTQLKRTESALRASEEKFRDLYDHAPLGYHEYDLEGRITNVNQTDLDMLGYSRDEMIGKLMWEFNVEREIAHHQIMAKLAGKMPPGRNLERTYWKKDGTTLPVLIEDRLIRDEEGQIRGMRCTIQDISELKRAKEALQRSEEETRRLAQENATVAEIGRIISSTLDIQKVYERFAEEVHKLIAFDRLTIDIIDPDKRTITVVYYSGFEIIEHRAGSIIPLAGTFSELVMHKRAGEIIQAENEREVAERYPSFVNVFRAGTQSKMSVPLISKDEVIGVLNFRSIKSNAYSERDLKLAERVGNEIAGAIANSQLFAQRMRAEEEKAALEEQLRQSQKIEAIGRLAGGIAHDFNKLLTVIRGKSELSLIKLKEGNPLRKNIEEILRASQRASYLTHQLFTFSRGQISEFKVLDLNTLLRNTEKILRRIIGENIELTIRFAEGIGKVKTNHAQIEQAILGLVLNARDAMPSGGKLTIETANVDLDEGYIRTRIGVKPGHYVMFSISDTGMGMTPEVKKHLFEPFFTTKEKGKGTGLALSAIYGIVKQGEGDIWVSSEPGQGTTFKIYLPRVEEEPSTRSGVRQVANK